jgi:hypothetical protein
MKQKALLITIISCFILLISCGEDDGYNRYYYNDSTIYSASDKTILSELVLFLSPYIEKDGQRHYVVVDNLKNLKININKRQITADKSYELDVSHLTGIEEIDGYPTTTERINYPFVINIRIEPKNPQTAGDYSEILNKYYVLPPGTYVSQIVSFDILTSSGSNTVYTPSFSFPLEVKENQASVGLGEFEVRIK